MSADKNSRVYRILVLEDNDADIYLLRKALRGAGLTCNLTVLTDGAAALNFVRDPEKYKEGGLPDLAVLDLNLPKIGGTEVLEAMRLNRDLAGVPVAIVTSSSSPRERARAEELGVKNFLTKPPDLKSFLHLGVILKDILLQDAANRQTPEG